MRERGISHREASALVWICVLPSMFLLEPSMSIARAGTSAYLVKVGSGLVFFALAWWMMVMVERYAARAGAFTLADFLAHYLTSGVARCVLALWAGLFLVHLILLLRTVAESTAKTALGQSEISLPLVLFGGAMMLGVRYRLTALLRASYLLALFAGGLVAVLVLFLLPMMQAELLLPWQGYGHAVTAREVVFDVGSWCAGTAVFLLFPMMRAKKGASCAVGRCRRRDGDKMRGASVCAQCIRLGRGGRAVVPFLRDGKARPFFAVHSACRSHLCLRVGDGRIPCDDRTRSRDRDASR